MNDLATLTAKPRPLVIDGETYAIHPLMLDDFGALQAWVDAQMPDPLAIAQARMDDFPSMAMQKHILSVAMELASKPKPRIGSEQADALVASPAGTMEVLYLSIRKGDPSFDRKAAAALYPKLQIADLARVFRDTDVDKVLSEPDPTAGPTAP